MITGFAAGKTRGVCAAAIEHAVRYPGAKILIGRKTYNETVNTVKQPFFAMATILRDGGWFAKPRKWDYREGTNQAQLVNGSQFLFSNLDDPVKFRNEEYSMVIVDQAEEINEELWEILIARIRWAKVPSSSWRAIAAANDNGHNWMWRRFVAFPTDHARSLKRCRLDPMCVFDDGHPNDRDMPQDIPCSTRQFFHGTTLDNKHNLAPRYLSVLLSHDWSWQQRFIYATMESGEGRLLPDPKVVEYFKPPSHWPKWRALDHALNSPACCLWLTVNIDERPFGGVDPDAVYVYREYYEPERSIDQHTRGILDSSTGERYQCDVMDKSAFHLTQSRTGGIRVSIADLYREESDGKLLWVPSVGEPFARVERIITAHRRGLAIARDCRHLLKQMPEYYAEASKSSGLFKIVNKSDFHAVDALGYGLMVIPINAARELAEEPGESKPDYMKREMDPIERVHHEKELRRFKKAEEEFTRQNTPGVFQQADPREFWGGDVVEPFLHRDYA